MMHSEGFLKLVEDAKKRIKEVSTEEVLEKINSNQNFILIDCREDHEWDQGHAKGAIHLGKGIIERDIEQAVSDKNEEVIIYCGGGFRSALACDSLQKMGYKNVYSMDGGWRKWKSCNYPEE